MGKQVEENGASGRKRRAFTREFKTEVVGLGTAGGADVDRDLPRARSE
jgi:hypothetical protein